MRLSIIPFIFLIVPALEIAAFIIIGGRIGVAATLGLVLATALLGTILLRWQGISTLRRINAEMQAGRVPSRDLVHGVMILVAGVLLLVPGFVTDCLGFALFIPALRDRVFDFFRKRVVVVTPGGGFAGPGRGSGQAGGQGPVVDLDAEEFRRTRPGKSPWSAADGRIDGPGPRDPGGTDGL